MTDDDVVITLTAAEAAEVREAILDTRAPWSPVLDRVTKRIIAALDEAARR